MPETAITPRARLEWHDRMASDPGLSHLAVRVALVIGQHFNNRSGEAFIARETIADRIGGHVRTVERAIQELETQGHLVVHRARGRGHANVYRMPSGDAEKATCTPPFGGAAGEEKATCTPPFGDGKGGVKGGLKGGVKGGASVAPTLLTQLTHINSPPSPQGIEGGEAQQDGRDGARCDAAEPPSFDAFWAWLQGGDTGPAGPAEREWRRLTPEDRRAIADARRDAGGMIDLGGTWAVTWLQGRYWERSVIRRRGTVTEAIDRLIADGGFRTVSRDDPDWPDALNHHAGSDRRKRSSCEAQGKITLPRDWRARS